MDFSAFPAVQVPVERCEHGLQVGRQRGRPHQQAQACLQAFACTLGVLKECLHLHAEFLWLRAGEPDLLDLQVKSPSAPGDAVSAFFQLMGALMLASRSMMRHACSWAWACHNRLRRSST